MIVKQVMTPFDTYVKLFGLPASSFHAMQKMMFAVLRRNWGIQKFKQRIWAEMGVFCGTQEHTQVAENYC